MKKEDLNVVALLFEAIDIVLMFIYMGMQIFYSVYYHANRISVVGNILVVILVYVFLTVLSNYPEKINRIPAEYCRGKVRKYSLRMVRTIKFVFVSGLMIPCVFDIIGRTIKDAYSLIIVGLILIIALYYEHKIIKEFKNNN